MRSPLGIIFFVIGIVLLVMGVVASDSVASSFSKLFTGEPTDKAIFLMIGGIASIAIGSVIGWRGSRA